METMPTTDHRPQSFFQISPTTTTFIIIHPSLSLFELWYLLCPDHTFSLIFYHFFTFFNRVLISSLQFSFHCYVLVISLSVPYKFFTMPIPLPYHFPTRSHPTKLAGYIYGDDAERRVLILPTLPPHLRRRCLLSTTLYYPKSMARGGYPKSHRFLLQILSFPH